MATRLKELKDWLHTLKTQGCRVDRRQDCALIYLPGGTKIVTVHYTSEDARALKNAKADYRRACRGTP